MKLKGKKMNDYYKKVYWYDEVDTTGDYNDSFIYGIYYYQDEEDFPIDVEWFKDESDRDYTYEKLNAELWTEEMDKENVSS